MVLTRDMSRVDLEAMDRQERAEALDDARNGDGMTALRDPVGRLIEIGHRHYVVARTYCCVADRYGGYAWEIGTDPTGELVSVSFDR